MPSDHRIYCVGDIHGRLDLLLRLRTRISTDLRAAPVSWAATIFVGDYVDRGPDSCRVVDFLCTEVFPTQLIALRGNHEQMLLDFLADPVGAQGWLKFGGIETLISYGVAVAETKRSADLWRIRDDLSRAMPASHLAFLQDTSVSAEFGGYFFCHAGIRPGVALADQSADDLLWIRDAFLAHTRVHPKVVVHGHTPVETPDIRPNRINIDTGAYVTGNLACLVLENCGVRNLDP